MTKPPTPRTTGTLAVLSENNHFQHLEVLKRNREKRHAYGEFFVEGVSAINLALQHGWEVSTVAYPRGVQRSSWAAEILAQSASAAKLELLPELFAKLSDKNEPGELILVVKIRPDSPERVPATAQGLVMVFDRPSNPGNLGTSIRSADAFGADGVIMTGHSVDLYEPQVIRSSVGTIFSTPVIRTQSHEAVAAWVAAAKAQGHPYQIVGTSGKGTSPIDLHPFEKPTVLIFGNETVGMSKGYWSICDTVLTIPVGGALSSLNVSCAASIALYEVARQRRVKSSR